MMSSYDELKQISKSQKRQRVALIVLSLALAASTIVTWKAVAALREVTQIQKQALEPRKPGTAPKTALRRPNLRSETQANASSRRTQGLARPGVQNATGDRPTAVDSAPDSQAPGKHASLERPGRQ